MDTDILIVGGGLNGPLAALALAQSGLRVTLFDARPRATFDDPAFDGRSYAVALGSVRMLQALDLWDGVEATAQPITGIRASDGRAGEGASPLHLAFDAVEMNAPFMGQMIEDRHLRPHLLSACDASPLVEMRFNASVVDQQADGGRMTITLQGGERVAGALLLGCDGRGSTVAMRAGIGRVGADYAQSALVCAVAHDRPHCGVAHQFFMPPGPLAILPLRENRSSIVWTEETATAKALNDLSDVDYLEVLRPRFGSFLGDFHLVGARHVYPLTLTLAEAFTGDRLALVGDAAHGIHPIAGQGLNLGFRDIAALAHVLSEARRRGEDIGARSVLERYARWRRFDTTAMGLATDMINRVFSNDNPLLRLGRDLGMGAISAMPSARRAFMREAAGLTGELPDLMRG